MLARAVRNNGRSEVRFVLKVPCSTFIGPLSYALCGRTNFHTDAAGVRCHMSIALRGTLPYNDMPIIPEWPEVVRNRIDV